MNIAKLGKIVKIRGFKGEIVSTTRFKNVEHLRTIKTIIIDEIIYEIEDFKNLKDRVGLKLKDINNEEKAKSFIGKTTFYDKDEVVINGTLTLDDMIDFEIKDENDVFYGNLDEILNFGAGDILVVKNGRKEYMLPQNKNLITGYDKDKKVIFVDGNLIKEVI